MYINFWYVAAESKDVIDDPVHSRMLGQDFVLFRDREGEVQCLSNICTHRGGALADGKVKGGCVECPYHGWQFDGTGTCRSIPSLDPSTKIPERSRIDAYPVDERYGLIHVFLGDLPAAERPPIMNIPEWGEDSWRPTALVFNADFDYKRSVENALDPAHNEFTHTTHIDKSRGESFHVPPLKLTESDWGSNFDLEMPAPAMFEKKMRAVSGKDKPSMFRIRAGYHGVSCFWTYIEPTPKFFRHQYFFETPIDVGKTRIYSIAFRNSMLEPKDDARMIKMDNLVVGEDVKVLLGVRPTVTPPTNTKEVLVPADSHIAKYREWLAEWEEKGYRIDIEEVKRTRDNTAYAIPSPARRTSQNWALDPIPLLPGQEVKAKAVGN